MRPETTPFQLALYADPDDACGPGFALTADYVEFLASLRAIVDADLYALTPQRRAITA